MLLFEAATLHLCVELPILRVDAGAGCVEEPAGQLTTTARPSRQWHQPCEAGTNSPSARSAALLGAMVQPGKLLGSNAVHPDPSKSNSETLPWCPKARRFPDSDLLMPKMRETSSIWKLIMVLLYMITEWLDWMKPMPPMSAARLNTCSQSLTTCRWGGEGSARLQLCYRGHGSLQQVCSSSRKGSPQSQPIDSHEAGSCSGLCSSKHLSLYTSTKARLNRCFNRPAFH